MDRSTSGSSILSGCFLLLNQTMNSCDFPQTTIASRNLLIMFLHFWRFSSVVNEPSQSVLKESSSHGKEVNVCKQSGSIPSIYTRYVNTSSRTRREDSTHHHLLVEPKGMWSVRIPVPGQGLRFLFQIVFWLNLHVSRRVHCRQSTEPSSYLGRPKIIK
jgi:hypothetical protein